MRDIVAAAVGVVIGVWLMAAPALFGYAGGAATSDRIVGPTAVAAAWIAGAEVTRSVRWLNVILGAWTIVSVVFLERGTGGTVQAAIAGFVLIVAALMMRGIRRDEFGGGWKSLFER